MTNRRVIVDREGEIPAADIRVLFEKVIKFTPKFSATTDVTPSTPEGEFRGYVDDITNAMWIGFAIGIRLMDRFERGGA